ncbi:hypothetical protein [Patulibacter minatonensis]|uniref:hypothetical protein n=1 Tax=Patulibacter minatonensis TaxID=298163 RepID=UPI000478B014|nr:hypothetical protein [Patulibacter minatonensis]
MPRTHALAVPALCALTLAAGVAPGTSSAAATAKSCKSVKDMGPTGSDPADAVSIRATGTSCANARTIARRWGRETVVQGPGAVRIRSYVCRDSTASGRFRIVCKGPGPRVVRFKLG